MATQDKRRQKKLERKKSKRKAAHKELSRLKQGGLASEIARITNAPVLDCLVADAIWENNVGIGAALLSRELRDGRVAFSTFLVDAYCLGVKDTHVEIYSNQFYRERVLSKILASGTYQEVSPSHLRKLVESAVEYARDLGFPPHKDYRIGKELFGSIDASACDTEFVFGREGKPCYVSGPYDSADHSQRIMSILTDRCGPGNFNFTIGGPSIQFVADHLLELDNQV